jgi:hypothetical protein
MALIDELLTQVEGDALRTVLAKEVEGLRQRMTFGLVFERHIPELTVVTGRVASRQSFTVSATSQIFHVRPYKPSDARGRTPSGRRGLHLLRTGDHCPLLRPGA